MTNITLKRTPANIKVSIQSDKINNINNESLHNVLIDIVENHIISYQGHRISCEHYSKTMADLQAVLSTKTIRPKHFNTIVNIITQKIKENYGD